jgi:hypothetical protein
VIAAVGSSQSAHFLGETVPDCSQMEPGQEFTKTWRLSNSGIATWAEGYGLEALSGSPASEDLGSPGFVPLPSSVAPGEEVQISVDLVAPEAGGVYTLYYGLRAADGSSILIDGGNLWVTIAVGGAVCGRPAPAGGDYAPSLTGVTRLAGSTTVQFCMKLPDGTPSWFPYDMALITGSQQVSADSAGVLNYQAGAAQRCFWASFPAEAGSGSEVLVGNIRIDAAVNQEANCARAQDELLASHPGLEFACGGRGYYYSLIRKPAGMSDAEADRIIMDALERAVYGPWVLGLE